MKTALVAGATGLIGNQVVDLLIADPAYNKIICLSRKPLKHNIDKVKVIETDVDYLNDIAELIKADEVFCCLGTTMKKAKTKDAFKKVDFDYPLLLAQIAKQNGARGFHLVSALGASAKSSIFYNRIKGEIEEEISNIGFESFHIYRPSLLLGPRSEERSGESAAKIFFKLFGFLVPRKYRPIDSLKVAKSMLYYSNSSLTGIAVHESQSMQSI